MADDTVLYLEFFFTVKIENITCTNNDDVPNGGTRLRVLYPYVAGAGKCLTRRLVSFVSPVTAWAIFVMEWQLLQITSGRATFVSQANLGTRTEHLPS
jgi:hypothetical protein